MNSAYWYWYFESAGNLPGLSGLLLLATGLVTVDQLERQLQCHLLVFCAPLAQAPLGHQQGPVPYLGVLSGTLLFGLTFKNVF